MGVGRLEGDRRQQFVGDQRSIGGGRRIPDVDGNRAPIASGIVQRERVPTDRAGGRLQRWRRGQLGHEAILRWDRTPIRCSPMSRTRRNLLLVAGAIAIWYIVILFTWALRPLED